MEIQFKEEGISERFQQCHPLLRNISIVMASWCRDRKLPFVITSARTTVEEDKALSRTSKTHREGRAIDVSVRGWSSQDINDFSSYFNKLYRDVAAITKARVPRLVVWHNNGNGEHLHIQIRRVA